MGCRVPTRMVLEALKCLPDIKGHATKEWSYLHRGTCSSYRFNFVKNAKETDWLMTIVHIKH